ncbi:hypothetical protein KSP40_PGU012699 [Platanthera guangdongensis]|uniref:Uncharacterized protein n=1 Tax=Platanthera guangdongensis TaxID=2320717 RepID=A0ABR2LG40_9ASPA
MYAPPTIQDEQEHNWINDFDAAVDSQLVTKQSEQEQLVNEQIILEVEGHVSCSEHALKEPQEDLPSLLLNGQIVHLDMRLVPNVMEFVIPKSMHLQWIDPKQPLYLYIKSPGATCDDGKTDIMECKCFAISNAFTKTLGEVRQFLISMIIFVFDPGGGLERVEKKIRQQRLTLTFSELTPSQLIVNESFRRVCSTILWLNSEIILSFILTYLIEAAQIESPLKFF